MVVCAKGQGVKDSPGALPGKPTIIPQFGGLCQAGWRAGLWPAPAWPGDDAQLQFTQRLVQAVASVVAEAGEEFLDPLLVGAGHARERPLAARGQPQQRAAAVRVG